MKYLLKKCGHQELGSMDESMRPQRGQYLLMAMKDEVLSFFPHLSQTQQNDFRLVPICPLYTNDKVYCRFVYHNDRYHGSTAVHPRNEYRLYLNREVQGGELKFFEGGIVIFRRINEEDFESGLYVDYIAPNESRYDACNSLLINNQLEGSGNYAIYNGVIDSFEQAVMGINIKGQEVKFAKEDVNFIAKTKNDISQLFTEKQFRDFVSVAYEHKCAITGTVIEYGNLNNLETAHIRPKSHGGPFLPSNGMSLCRDFHWAFDHGFLALSDDCRVMVSEKAPSSLLLPYNGKKIFLPSEPFFQPKLEYIQYHRKHIYEHFEQIRAAMV